MSPTQVDATRDHVRPGTGYTTTCRQPTPVSSLGSEPMRQNYPRRLAFFRTSFGTIFAFRTILAFRVIPLFVPDSRASASAKPPRLARGLPPTQHPGQ